MESIDFSESTLDELYEYFGVNQSSTVRDIKIAFRQKAYYCVPHHNPTGDMGEMHRMFNFLCLICPGCRPATPRRTNSRVRIPQTTV